MVLTRFSVTIHVLLVCSLFYMFTCCRVENGITIECAVNRFPRTAEICLVLRPFPQKGLNHEISFFFCDMTIGSLYDFIFRHNTLWKLLSVRLKFIAIVQIVERDFSINPSPKFVHTSMKYLHELINRWVEWSGVELACGFGIDCWQMASLANGNNSLSVPISLKIHSGVISMNFQLGTKVWPKLFRR